MSGDMSCVGAGEWHWKCDGCGAKATTTRTPRMVRDKLAPGIPKGWKDIPRRVGLHCASCGGPSVGTAA